MSAPNAPLHRRDCSKLLLCGSALQSSLYADDEPSGKNASVPHLKKNVVLVSVGLGFLPQNFTPDRDTLQSRYLSKFSGVHDRMTVFNDIEQPERLGGHRNHHSVFTCQSRFGKTHTPFVSLDQLIAAKVEQTTRKKFLTVSTGSQKGMSFNMNGLSVPALGTPQELHEYLFGRSSSSERLEAQKRTLAEFRNRLVKSGSDPFYRDVLEENAQVLESDIRWAKIKPAQVDYRFTPTRNAILDLPIYLDLIRLGLKTKQANIVTLSVANGGAVPLEGVTQGYHANSHHNNEKSKLDELGVIEDFITDQLADFVDDLKKDELLDDTIVLIAGNMGDPSRHSMKDMSVILAGGGFKHTGRRVPCKDKGRLVRPLANLYTTVLHQSGLSGFRGFAGIPGDMDDILL